MSGFGVGCRRLRRSRRPPPALFLQPPTPNYTPLNHHSWGKAIKKLSNLDAHTIVGSPQGPDSPGTHPPLAPGPGPVALPPPVPLAPGAPMTAAHAVAAAGLHLPPPTPLVVAQIEERDMTEADARVEVPFPQDPDREYLLSRTARYVAKDGAAFEGRLREQEAGNPAFRFLFDYEGEEGRFYRWRVYSLLMGDRETRWRTKPFQMTPDGPFWVPPPIPEAYIREEEERETERQRREQRERERERERAETRRGRGAKSRSRSRSRSRGNKRDGDGGGGRRGREEKYLTGRQAERARDIARGRGASYGVCVYIRACAHG